MKTHRQVAELLVDWMTDWLSKDRLGDRSGNQMRVEPPLKTEHHRRHWNGWTDLLTSPAQPYNKDYNFIGVSWNTGTDPPTFHRSPTTTVMKRKTTTMEAEVDCYQHQFRRRSNLSLAQNQVLSYKTTLHNEHILSTRSKNSLLLSPSPTT